MTKGISDMLKVRLVNNRLSTAPILIGVTKSSVDSLWGTFPRVGGDSRGRTGSW